MWNNFISTLDVVKTWKARFDPVDDLLYDGNNPNAEWVISEFNNYLMNYEHVIEADEVKTHQWCCCVYKIWNSYGLKYVHDKISKDILDCKYAKIDIWDEKDNQIAISYELADSKWTLLLNITNWSIGNQIITSSEFIQQSNLDENGVGYAKMKNNKYSFVRLHNGELQRVSDIEFDSIELQKSGFYNAINWKLRKIVISTADDIVISIFDYETMKWPDVKYNVFGKDTFIIKHWNFRNFVLVDNEEIKEMPLFDKNWWESHGSIHSLKIEENDLRGYTEDRCLTVELGSDRGREGFKQYIKLLKNGDVYRSPILKSTVWKRGGISDSKLMLYKFDEVNDMSYVPEVYTIIWYWKKNDIIAKTDEWYIRCFDESYNPKDAKELCGDRGFGWIVTTNKDSIYFVIKGTEVLQVDYEILDKSKKEYDWVYFVSIKKNGKYGILMYKNNELCSVVMDCVVDSKPDFLDDHIFYGDKVYEIKGTELSIVKHDFDEIIRYEWSVIVKKEGKYYFATMKSPGNYSVVWDAFDSKLEIFENCFVAIRNNQYVIWEFNDQTKTASELYTFAIKPDLQLYEKFGSLIFEKEWSYAILTKQQLVAWKLPSIQFAYSEVGALNDKWYIRLRKRWSSERAVYDFLTKEWLFISNDKVDCIYFDDLPENDTTVVWTTDEYRKALYAIEKWMIYRISDKSWSYCEIERLSNSIEWQTVYTMELFMFTDSSYNSKTLEFEYILKKKLLWIDHVSYFRLKNNTKKRSEFKIENGMLQKSAIIW